MKFKVKYGIILTIFILSLISSIVLAIVPIDKACGIQEGCYQVQTSQYEKTFGINNSYIGLVTFTIISLLTIIYMRRPKKHAKTLKIMITLGIIAGFAYAAWFLYIQFFMIKAVCKYCMVIDIGAVINLILIFWREK